MQRTLTAIATAVAMASFMSPVFAGMDEAKKWVETEFQPSTLGKEAQMKEMEWFIKAAEPFRDDDKDKEAAK